MVRDVCKWPRVKQRQTKTYRVLGWNRNRQPGMGTKKGSFRLYSHEMPHFRVHFLEKGSLCLVCVYIATESREPRHTGPPQKGPF